MKWSMLLLGLLSIAVASNVKTDESVNIDS